MYLLTQKISEPYSPDEIKLKGKCHHSLNVKFTINFYLYADLYKLYIRQKKACDIQGCSCVYLHFRMHFLFLLFILCPPGVFAYTVFMCECATDSNVCFPIQPCDLPLGRTCFVKNKIASQAVLTISKEIFDQTFSA